MTAWARLAAVLRHRVLELSRRSFLVPSGTLALGDVLQRMTVLRLRQFVTALNETLWNKLRLVCNVANPPLTETLALFLVLIVGSSYPRNPITVILLCITVW